MNGQTEQMNQVVKQYLQEYMNYHQTNWVSLLLLTQLTYNISINATTDQTLFFTNYRYNANLFLKLKKATVLAEQANITVEQLKKVHRELQ